MKKVLFKGVGTAIATPFDENGINIDEFKKLISFQIQNGVNSIIVCGTTGEASTISMLEKKELVKIAVSMCKGIIPVIVGVGSNDTKQVIENCKIMEELGADGLLIVTPYYNKCTQDGLITHFTKIANSTFLPIILYNVPGRTGVNITPSTCFTLSKLSNIVGLKEASGNISQVAKISALCKDELPIYSGNDDQILPILSLGGIGVISVLSNVHPKETVNIVQNFFNNTIDEAKYIQLSELELINLLFDEVNPIPVKEALNILGFDFGIPRLPLTPCSNTLSLKLKNILK